jgi:hypothetical protein
MVIPKEYRPYKLLIIAGLPKNQDNLKQQIFVLLKFFDEESYSLILTYLCLNFNFKPIIIHTDFEKGIQLAIKNNINLKKCNTFTLSISLFTNDKK